MSKTNNSPSLPPGWVLADLSAIAQINPPLDRCVINDTIPVNFVPMKAVEPEGGGLARPEICTYGEVKKGYTPFLSGDVIMAKITPCMENGKTAVVPDLPDSVCFGSTEFHVFRPEQGINPHWLSYYLLQSNFRKLARMHMAGSAGQLRVPALFLDTAKIPLPPLPEQKRILEKVEELLSDIDVGVAALKRVQRKLTHYRASVLKAAVEGSLTAKWRQQHPQTESASEILSYVLAERRRYWEEEQLRKFAEAKKEPPKNWKAKYKEPFTPDKSKLPALPKGWCWTAADQLCFQITDGEHIQPRYQSTGRPMLSAKNVRDGFIDFGDFDLISEQDFAKCLKRCAPTENDVLIVSVGATTGRAGIVGLCDPFSIVRSVLLLRPIVAPRYLLRWIQSPWCQTYIQRASGSTAQAHLYITDTKQIPVPLPPLPEMEHIIEETEQQISVIEELQTYVKTEIRRAASLRQSTLRHAFMGKLVQQDPNDEPASELLKRIVAAREERGQQASSAKRSSVKKKQPRKRVASI
jgi:type I restriction enzyme, S subunit